MKNGAVYQIGQVDSLPKGVLGEGFTSRVRPTMTPTKVIATPSPSSKRPRMWPDFARETPNFVMGTGPPVPKRKEGAEGQAPMRMPEEFLANPQFQFEHRLPPEEGFDVLMEVLSEEEVPDTESRPQRSRAKTRLYQAEEEQKEREKRATSQKNTEEKKEEG